MRDLKGLVPNLSSSFIKLQQEWQEQLPKLNDLSQKIRLGN